MWDGSWRELVYFRAAEKIWVGWNVCKKRSPLKGVHWDWAIRPNDLQIFSEF